MKVIGITDRGLVRSNNQDSYVLATNEKGELLALVCDGIGGNNSGDVASQEAIQYFSDAFSKNRGFKDVQDVQTWLLYHARKANDAVFSKSVTKKEYYGMGTTLVGILISRVGYFSINIGDSRAYAYNIFDEFYCLTVDHTLVRDMLNHGEITVEQMKNHPKKNVLTNALGIWNDVRADIQQIHDEVKIFLVCSDGLHGYVDEQKIAAVLADDDLPLQKKAKRLMNAALFAGGLDNITILLIETEGGVANE